MKWLSLLSLVACSDKAIDSVPLDTSSCETLPVVNYANFGEGFITHYCQGCHASTAPDRYDAPEAITFDDAAQIWALSDRILARAAADPPTMPPAGGTSEDDRTKLIWWLTCAEPGT